MSLHSIFHSSNTRPITQGSQSLKSLGLSSVINFNFSLTTHLLLGASIQSILCFFIRDSYYVLVLASLLLTIRIIYAILIHNNIAPNPYLSSVIPGKSTAIVPNQSGTIAAPANHHERIALCLLGAKSNHPFGLLAPEFRNMYKWLQEMNENFDTQDKVPAGFLGQTNWQRKDERGAVEVMFLSYWRSIEDLHAFAHSPLHRDAWAWFEKTIKTAGYMGVNHEIYEADRGYWENVYINFQPTGLGATTYLRKGDGKVEGGGVADEWISPLIDARKGKIRSSAGRLGRGGLKFDEGRPTGDVYLD